MKKLLILTLLVTSIVAISFVNLNGTDAPVAVKKLKGHSNFAISNIISKANAGAGEDTLRDVARLLYFTVAGYPDEATKNALNAGADVGGMVGIAADYMAIAETILAENDITACSDIGDSGSYIGTYEGVSVEVTLATPVKTKPVGYPLEGATYEKRVQMALLGNPEMKMEFDCDRKTGWFLHNESGSGRLMEFYYDVEDTSAVITEFFMNYVDGANDDRLHVKFTTEANNLYNLDVIQSIQSGEATFKGFRLALRGDWGTEESTVMSQKTINADSFANVALEALASEVATDYNNPNRAVFCINSDGSTSTNNTPCASLILSSRSGEKPAIDTAGTLSVDWVAKDDGMISKMTAF